MKQIILLLGDQGSKHLEMVFGVYESCCDTDIKKAATGMDAYHLQVAEIPLSSQRWRVIYHRAEAADTLVLRYPASRIPEDDVDKFYAFIDEGWTITTVKTSDKALNKIMRRPGAPRPPKKKRKQEKQPEAVAAAPQPTQEPASPPPKRQKKSKKQGSTFPDEDILALMEKRLSELRTIRRNGARFFVEDDHGNEGTVRYMRDGEFAPDNTGKPSSAACGRNGWAARLLAETYQELQPKPPENTLDWSGQK